MNFGVDEPCEPGIPGKWLTFWLCVGACMWAAFVGLALLLK
jgi:hypothetical protein